MEFEQASSRIQHRWWHGFRIPVNESLAFMQLVNDKGYPYYHPLKSPCGIKGQFIDVPVIRAPLLKTRDNDLRLSKIAACIWSNLVWFASTKLAFKQFPKSKLGQTPGMGWVQMCENSEPSLECGPRSPYRIEVRLSKFKISENTFPAFFMSILHQNTMTWYFHTLRRQHSVPSSSAPYNHGRFDALQLCSTGAAPLCRISQSLNIKPRSTVGSEVFKSLAVISRATHGDNCLHWKRLKQSTVEGWREFCWDGILFC